MATRAATSCPRMTSITRERLAGLLFRDEVKLWWRTSSRRRATEANHRARRDQSRVKVIAMDQAGSRVHGMAAG